MSLRATFERVVLETPLPRSSHSLSVVAGKAYLFGGEVRPREPVDSAVHAFPVLTSSTTASTSSSIPVSTVGQDAGAAAACVPPSRVGHTAARVGSGIYVFGGRGGKEMQPLDESGRVWKFDTETTRWTALDPATSSSSTPFPEARSYHSSTGSTELGKIFVHAGCPASGRATDVWSFDVSQRTWAQLPSAPGAPRGGPGFTYGLKKLWRYGGFDGKNELGGQLDYLDLSGAGQGWKSVSYEATQCPGPRSVTGLQVVAVKGQPHLVAFLGERDASNLGHAGAGVFWGDVWSLALTSQGEPSSEGVWKKCTIDGPGLPERGWFASDVVDDDKILVYGGLNAKNERERDGILISFEAE